MTITNKINNAEVRGLRYDVIQSGKEDTSSLRILAQALKPSFDALPNNLGPREGMIFVDVAKTP